MPAPVTDALCCPRCGGPLADVDGGYRCGRCAGAYPVFGSIPCLVDDPALWRTLWLRRLDDYRSGIEARVAALRQEADGGRAAAAHAQALAPDRDRLRATDRGGDSRCSSRSTPEPITPSPPAFPSRPEPGSRGDPRSATSTCSATGCGARASASWRWRSSSPLRAGGARARRRLRRRRGAARGRHPPEPRAGAHARARRQPAAVPGRATSCSRARP